MVGTQDTGRTVAPALPTRHVGTVLRRGRKDPS